MIVDSGRGECELVVVLRAVNSVALGGARRCERIGVANCDGDTASGRRLQGDGQWGVRRGNSPSGWEYRLARLRPKEGMASGRTERNGGAMLGVLLSKPVRWFLAGIVAGLFLLHYGR